MLLDRDPNYVVSLRDEEALADLNQALALDGTNAAAYAERGAILQKLRDLDRAAADFARLAAAHCICRSRDAHALTRCSIHMHMGQAHDHLSAHVLVLCELTPGWP